ncbi:MAG: hypothetical protein Q6373_000235 [Candidatus Sigynarchaeota archaeon]
MGKLDLAKLKAEVDQEMSKGKAPNAANKLQGAFNNKDLTSADFQQFGEILRDCIVKDPESFMEKGYILFDKMTRPRNAAKLSEFEKFFVQNFCKLPGEEFSVIFDGWVETGKSWINGNVFVSNMRIIATGVQEAKGAGVSGGGMFAFLSMINLGSYLYNKAIMDQIAKSVSGASGTFIPFGVIYPIKGCYEVAQESKGFGVKNPNRVKYKIDVPFTNKKGKEEIADMTISVIPNRDWKSPEMAEILGKVEATLKSVAKA